MRFFRWDFGDASVFAGLLVIGVGLWRWSDVVGMIFLGAVLVVVGTVKSWLAEKTRVRRG